MAYFSGDESDDELRIVETTVRFRYALRTQDAPTSEVTGEGRDQLMINYAIDAYLQPEDPVDRFTVVAHEVRPYVRDVAETAESES